MIQNPISFLSLKLQRERLLDSGVAYEFQHCSMDALYLPDHKQAKICAKQRTGHTETAGMLACVIHLSPPIPCRQNQKSTHPHSK